MKLTFALAWALIPVAALLASAPQTAAPAQRKIHLDRVPHPFELLNRKADGFRGIWYYNQSSGDEYVYKYSGGMGVYCAGHIPMGVYSKEVDKTFFCFGGTDAGNTTLLQSVSYFDHRTGKLARPTVVFDKHTIDAHDNAVLNLDDKGYIYIFSSSHGRTRPSAIARSDRPYDISRFSVIWEGNYSYPQPFYFPGKGFLFLHTRYVPNGTAGMGRRSNCFMTSDPDVSSWSACETLQLFNEGHYQRSWPFGAKKVGLAFDQHPKGKGLNWRTDVFYMETDDYGKTWRTAAGEPLTLPVASRDTPALAVPYAEKSRNVYIKGVKFDRSGRPIVLYTVSKGYRAGPAAGPREWKLAKWTGTEWREIDTGIRSDSNYDFAELYVDDERDWRIIGATERGPQPYNPGGEIAAWASHDAGETWSFEKKLTNGSERNQNYPRQPLNVNPGFYAFWADGHGRKPSISSLYFCDKALNVYMMPLAFEGDFADPIPYVPAPAVPTAENGITAHRGDSIRHPQNSLEAFSAANETGADWIETDIHLTRDGVLVISHNATTKAYSSTDLRIGDSTYAELAKLDMAETFRAKNNLTLEQCPKLRIARLDEALDLILRERKARLSLQPKCDCVDQAIALVRSKGAIGWVGFNDGNLKLMSRVKELEPSVPVFWDRHASSDIAADIPVAKARGFETLVLFHKTATPELVASIHAAGLKVGVWTVNAPSELKRFLDMGMDRIYTDAPQTLKDIKSAR